MKKFTSYESAIIIACLNEGLLHDLADIKATEEAGRNPLFTAEYTQELYVDLIGKVEEMTKKK